MCLQEDPRALLYHSRDSIADEVEDTPDARRRGYRRMALFSLVFFPAGIQVRVPYLGLYLGPHLAPL